jgi:tetratricopeptide (TPR) repeat protein
VLPVILIVSFIAFIPALNAGFVNLDDGDYVTHNPLVSDWSRLGSLLATPVQGNYHPLTMLSLAINYQVSGDHAWSYHLLNILLHLINCFLVFRLAMLLSNKNIIIAFTTAVLFGIHPLHVESVAWVSERKDVLYSLFFLAGLISYTKFIDTGSKKQYGLIILFLILSLLSKPAAVIFPLVLFCIDLLRKRKLTLKLAIEKIPFFVLALAGGILTLVGQKAAGAIGQETYSVTTKVFFGFYGFMMYIVKIITPFNFAVFYPYPAINENLPLAYYLSPLFFIALAILFFYSLKRNRVIGFGLSFYFVNLLLVLQILPVGSAIIAERYTYIPYIGLFYLAGWEIDRWAKGNMQKARLVIFPIVFLLSIITWNQSSRWHDSATLWDQAIANQPSNKAYANRAVLYRAEKKYDSAIVCFNKAIEMHSIDYESYNNRGNVYFDMKKPEQAMNDYRKAISIKADYYPAFDNMAAQLATIGQYDSALKYENKALQFNPDYKVAYSNRALIYMRLNRNEEAIKDWQKLLQFDPNAADVYNMIGSCYEGMGKYQEALPSITKAIQMNGVPEFYLNRAYAYQGLKNIEAAKQDALAAQKGGLKIPDDLARSLGIQ